MKSLIIFIFTFNIFTSAISQTIDGEFIGGSSTEKIYLKHYPDLMGYQHENMQIDSSDIKDGRFHFDFKIGKMPRSAKIIQMKRNKETGREEYLGEFRIFLAADSIIINLSDSLKNIIILNSNVNYEATIFNEIVNPATKKIADFSDMQIEENKKVPIGILKSEFYSRYQTKRIKSLKEARAKLYINFIKENPYSWISLYAFVRHLGQDGNNITTENIQLYNTLGTKLKTSELGISLAKRIEAKNKVMVGKLAPEFTLKDSMGFPVNLSDYRGKYILVEFWASWCGACRFEAPFLKLGYSKYRNSGFEILSVSLDDEALKYSGRKTWLKAIKEDGTGIWKQVSDLKGWKSPVAVMYDIQALPQNYLIDPTGKIISENLKGADLMDKLEDIFYK